MTCSHPIDDRKIITVTTPRGNIEHAYCRKCGKHFYRGRWQKLIKVESQQIISSKGESLNV